MRSFIGFGQKPYIGIPSTLPIKIGGVNAQSIPLNFNWISYGASSLTPNINVLVSIENPTCRALDQIRSVYIDNLGSVNPVYINFPDTNYTVVAKPNSEGWYPVYSNSRVMWVIGEGFFTGSIPSTFIILTNRAEVPAVNNEIDQAVALWRASPIITRGTSIYNTALGTPSLADQAFASALLDAATLGATVNLWNTPFGSGFLYIRSLVINFTITVANPATGGSLLIDILSTGAAGVLAQVQTYAFAGAGTPNLILWQDANVQLDATQTWRMQIITNSNVTGTLQAITTFTQQ